MPDNQSYIGRIIVEGSIMGFCLTLVLYTIMTVVAGCSYKGERGDNGSSVSVLTYPASPSQCSNGGTVVQLGSVVYISCNGTQGPSGPQGLPGLNAPTITIVPLCNDAPVYPSVFTEVGICLEGSLYAIYSAHGGFLTYLPPGQYSSNAIGSRCNLTVHNNCVVSH